MLPLPPSSPLWKRTLAEQAGRDPHKVPRGKLREALLAMREKAKVLVDEIPRDIPGLTVHDVTHLDALWKTASVLVDDKFPLNPAEAFVLGGAILLHDAAMSLAAYPEGLEGLKKEVEWQDAAALAARDETAQALEPAKRETLIKAKVLRQRHAQQAAALATRGWETGASREYLIDDPDLREFHGEIIGAIAHSHWWPVAELAAKLHYSINAPAFLPDGWEVDPIKVACLLRAADAAHLDAQRAPRFLMALTRPEGESALHWTFQKRLAQVKRQGDRLLYTTGGTPFRLPEADAWWTCHDALVTLQHELHEVDALLEDTHRPRLAARQVAGIGAPKQLARHVRVDGWEPVDASLRVSDIGHLVETLGGKTLYGDDNTVPLRELIQNACDAIRARRLREKRPESWGTVTVSLPETADGVWLEVADDGVGMSERVLTGALLDFGRSFWRSPLAAEEFPGLAASGMEATGRFGIGFYSVFMLGDRVTVTTRRHDASVESTLVLEFRGGLGRRPLVRPAETDERLIEGGTRVRVLLRVAPNEEGGVFHKNKFTAPELLAWLAPAIDANLDFFDRNFTNYSCIKANDWKFIDINNLFERITERSDSYQTTILEYRLLSWRMRNLIDDYDIWHGRACISSGTAAVVVVGGLRAGFRHGAAGLLVGTPKGVTRDKASLSAPASLIAHWATAQANLVTHTREDKSKKACIANYILAVGGAIGALPLGRLGAAFLTCDQLLYAINNMCEIIVLNAHNLAHMPFPGHPDSGISVTDFYNQFLITENVFQIYNIITPDTISCAFPDRRPKSCQEALEEIISEVWGGFTRTGYVQTTIGHVRDIEIKRNAMIYQRP